MIGNKLRAWMEAVRPKKKQHRKDKHEKNISISTGGPKTTNHRVTWKNTALPDNDRKHIVSDPVLKCIRKQKAKNNHTNPHLSRYSATNLSSPESAYSTGYSTDGTSPGAQPECPINSSNKETKEKHLQNSGTVESKVQMPCSSKRLPNSKLIVIPAAHQAEAPLLIPKDKKSLKGKDAPSFTPSVCFYPKLSNNSSTGIMSPRQRNRIRTNPWLPGGMNSSTPSPLPARQRVKVNPIATNYLNTSPVHKKYLTPISHKRSLSSSSCSSFGNHIFDYHFTKSLSDEEDCTLNEMLGKYDESYIYEKETDILSDSDPTECESDIDTGQDGGDEDDTAEAELDFIDNDSSNEIDVTLDNKGHCMYFMSPDVHRKKSSRKRGIRRSKEFSERKRRSSSSKRYHRYEKIRSFNNDGSKSVGGTPTSFRKSAGLPSSYFHTLYDSEKHTFVMIDKRDREADLKYKELISQAELIIRTMNINGLSPRRLPGLSNKRVELIKSTECKRPETVFKNKPNDEILTVNSNQSPSTAIHKGTTRFSPKKNHITNFIINNSPVLIRKELQEASSIRRSLAEDRPLSPLVSSKQYPLHQDSNDCTASYSQQTGKNDLILSPGNSRVQPSKGILRKCEHTNNHTSIFSPRHRKILNTSIASSSSDEEPFQKAKKKMFRRCPQSEPMKRKSYFWGNLPKCYGKTAIFNVNNDVPNIIRELKTESSENLRHQILLNTIQNLKKNLEDQSASLQKTYKTTHRIYGC